jgi:DNA-directed RNA polymerase subunit RPC12/RpoP
MELRFVERSIDVRSRANSGKRLRRALYNAFGVDDGAGREESPVSGVAEKLETIKCPHCGTPNSAPGQFCGTCGTPLSADLVNDPFLSWASAGVKISRTVPPTKPFAIVGTWLIAGTTALGACICLMGSITLAFRESGKWALYNLGLAFGAILLSGFLLAMSVTILFRQTKYYLRNRPAGKLAGSAIDESGQGITAPSNQSRVEEILACLHCGKTIAPHAVRCPACGWSYQEESSLI